MPSALGLLILTYNPTKTKAVVLSTSSPFQAFIYYRRAVSGERIKLYTGKTGGGGRERGNACKTFFNNKGLFRYTGSKYTSYWSIMTPCVNTLAEGERHLLSNHANIEATNYNAIKHFLYVESFRDEQKICLNLVRRGQEIFAILPTGSGLETLIF